MFSIFLKQNNEYKFYGLSHNDEKDIWLKNFIEKLDLKVADLKIFKYEKKKMKKFADYLMNDNPKNTLSYIDDGRIEQVSLEGEEYGDDEIPTDLPDDLSLVYYSADEITKLNENQAAFDNWAANGYPEGFKLPNPEITKKKGRYLKKLPNKNVIDTLDGVEININDHLKLETDAIEKGSKKLD